jgi:hypothetical protein
MWDMDQIDSGFDPVHKKIRKEVFLEDIDRVVAAANEINGVVLVTNTSPRSGMSDV